MSFVRNKSIKNTLTSLLTISAIELTFHILCQLNQGLMASH